VALQKIKFQTNITLELALRFTEGKLCDSQFGDPQYMFTTIDDRVFFVAEKVATKIHGLHPQPREPLDITKAEVDYVNGRKGIEWRVAKVGFVPGEQPDGTFAVPIQPVADVTAPAPVAAASHRKAQTATQHWRWYQSSEWQRQLACGRGRCAKGTAHDLGAVPVGSSECSHRRIRAGLPVRKRAARQPRARWGRACAAGCAFTKSIANRWWTNCNAWLEAQFAERKTEPNSGLGKAITYLLRHWKGLTLFLREVGASLR
jgi:hypothetical protein